MANLILCPCLHSYMKIPCMHHHGPYCISEHKKKWVFFNYLCCLHQNITLKCSVLKHFIDETSHAELVLSFEQTKCISPHLTVAHVCVWSWKLLIVCFSFLSLAVKSLHPCVVVSFFLPFILNKTSLTWLIFKYKVFTFHPVLLS